MQHLVSEHKQALVHAELLGESRDVPDAFSVGEKRADARVLHQRQPQVQGSKKRVVEHELGARVLHQPATFALRLAAPQQGGHFLLPMNWPMVAATLAAALATSSRLALLARSVSVVCVASALRSSSMAPFMMGFWSKFRFSSTLHCSKELRTKASLKRASLLANLVASSPAICASR